MFFEVWVLNVSLAQHSTLNIVIFVKSEGLIVVSGSFIVVFGEGAVMSGRGTIKGSLA